MRIAAFDVDLGRLHGYSSVSGRICYNAQDWPWDAIDNHSLLLVEIAHPVNTSRTEAEAYNRRKWAIGNALAIGQLVHYLDARGCLSRLLVSPSNWWTLKHPEAMRDVVANCTGEDNHDIRACRAMLVYHKTNPEMWMPIDRYYKALSTPAATKKKRKSHVT